MYSDHGATVYVLVDTYCGRACSNKEKAIDYAVLQLHTRHGDSEIKEGNTNKASCGGPLQPFHERGRSSRSVYSLLFVCAQECEVVEEGVLLVDGSSSSE